MVFASLEFLTLFFPLFLLSYSLSPRALKNLTLLVFSWVFYAWWSPSFLWVLVGVTLLGWVVGLGLSSLNGARQRKFILAASVLAMVALLAYYKYANLIVLELIEPYLLSHDHGFTWERLILPIGISFIVLQAISYIVDVYRGTVKAERSFVAYAAYQAMFSQLIAGPIVRYAHVEHELHERPFDARHVAAGLRYFMIGLSMKVIIADTLAPVADACFALSQPSMADAWLGAFAYGMQLFFDFAGYSAMAIGMGQMLGFRFPENFDAPYIARSIQEFWRRWHMTLGSWLRDYVYIPLGGGRVAPWRVYLNLMLVMAISGLWHGADSANFLLWGMLHGLAMVIQRLWERNGLPRLPALLAWGLTMLFVFTAWILFRSPDLVTAWGMYQGQIGLNGFVLSEEVELVLRPVHGLTMLLALVAASWPLWRERLSQDVPLPGVVRDVLTLWPLFGMLVAMALMSSRGAAPFLYFQF
jgi:alginate O-acetyltransferase complex protein AlgI